MRFSNAAGVDELLPAWEGLRKAAPSFGPIRSERDLARMNSLMESLLEQIGDNEEHPLGDLLDVISTLIAQYEDASQPEIKAEPREVLKLLMEQSGLTQSDLRNEVGTQGVVSEILAGHREINARQARALAERFRVSPAIFL